MGKEDVSKFLGGLSAAGIRLWASEGALQFRAPPGAMSATVRAAVSERKHEILAVLGAPQFHARGTPAWTPILRYHEGYWRQLRDGEFDVGFTNGTSFVLKCNGRLDPQLLSDRVAWLASRHSILRARVVERNEVGFVFDQSHESLLEVVDLARQCGGSSDGLKVAADDLVWRPFDPLNGPMARVFAIRASASEFLLGLVVHHFICDGWSLQVLAKELLSGPTVRDTPALQYSDYIRGMNQWLDGWGLQHRLEYWKAQLAGAPVTRLPPDFECDPDASAALVVDRFSVPATVASALSDLARRKETTIFTVLLAAKMCALSWLVGTPDIVVLIQHHHRDDAMLLGVVGALTDRLPVRVQISIQRSFADNLASVQEALKAAYTYDVPFSLLENVLPEIQAGGIAPALNFLSSTARTETRAPSQAMEPFRVTPAPKYGSPRKHSAHWMNVAWNGRGLHGSVGYSSVLYRRETFARLLSVLGGALEAIAQDPERAVAQLCSRTPSGAAAIVNTGILELGVPVSQDAHS